jgi:hypothetical protein
MQVSYRPARAGDCEFFEITPDFCGDENIPLTVATNISGNPEGRDTHRSGPQEADAGEFQQLRYAKRREKTK